MPTPPDQPSASIPPTGGARPPEDEAAARILLLGVRIRALTAAAPWFGPRAAPEVEATAWAELDQRRAELAAELDALADGDADLRPVLMLEAEGCGESCYNSLRQLTADADRLGAPPSSPEEAATLSREVAIFRSRLAAARGEADPEHHVGDRPHEGGEG